jgi:hypothetical protein
MVVPFSLTPEASAIPNAVSPVPSNTLFAGGAVNTTVLITNVVILPVSAETPPTNTKLTALGPSSVAVPIIGLFAPTDESANVKPLNTTAGCHETDTAGLNCQLLPDNDTAAVPSNALLNGAMPLTIEISRGVILPVTLVDTMLKLTVSLKLRLVNVKFCGVSIAFAPEAQCAVVAPVITMLGTAPAGIGSRILDAVTANQLASKPRRVFKLLNGLSNISGSELLLVIAIPILVIVPVKFVGWIKL